MRKKIRLCSLLTTRPLWALQVLTMCPGIVLGSFLMPLSATAQDLPYCEFLIDFPEDPHIESRCVKDVSSLPPSALPTQDEPTVEEAPTAAETCQTTAEYTKVYIGEATLSINLLCRQSSAASYQRFNLSEMEETLIQQAELNGVAHYRVVTDELENKTKYAILTGGRVSKDNTADIIMNQLWISPFSILSVEGKIEGRSTPAIDEAFSTVLRSIRRKKEPAALSVSPGSLSPELDSAETAPLPSSR